MDLLNEGKCQVDVKIVEHLIAKYAQEIKTQEDITEGYFKVEFKPFLGKDLLEALGRMQTLWQMGCSK